MPVRLVPCWRKLVACAPYGRALSSLLYKHEQNARGANRTGNYSYHQKKRRCDSHPLTIIFKPQKEKNRPCGFALYEKRNFYILQRLGKCP